LQCEVKNKKNVHESLQTYVQGEVLDGDNKYFCDTCSRHVGAVKRACVQVLPDVLLLHLKRFDFDMEVLKKLKIYDRYEFPMLLNMEPYTSEYIASTEQQQQQQQETGGEIPSAGTKPNEIDIAADDVTLIPADKRQFWYRLVGVIVHTGSSDSGHYYSYIRERVPRFSEVTQETRWLQFNDSTVEPFNPKDIPTECFGGNESVSNWDPQLAKYIPRLQSKPYSAYMLFYEKVTRSDLQDRGTLQQLMTYAQAQSIFPQVKLIRARNREFLRDKLTCNESYFNFLLELYQKQWAQFQLQVSRTPPGENAGPSSVLWQHNIENITHSATHIFVNILSHAKDKGPYAQWVVFLKDLYRNRVPLCQWFLQMASELDWLGTLLLRCYVKEVQVAFGDLLLFVIGVVRPVEIQMFGERSPSKRAKITELESRKQRKIHEEGDDDSGEDRENENEDSDTAGSSDEDDDAAGPSGIKETIVAMLRLLEDAAQYWRQFDTFFYVMRMIADLGWEERALFISEAGVSKLLTFYLGDDVPRHLQQTADPAGAAKKKKKRRMGDKFTAPPLQDMMAVLSLLITSCEFSARGDPSPCQLSGPPLTLNPYEMKLMWCSTDPRPSNSGGEIQDQHVFFYRQVREHVNIEASIQIFRHLSWNNSKFTTDLALILIDSIDLLNADEFLPFFQVLGELLDLKDSISERPRYIVEKLIEVSLLSTPEHPHNFSFFFLLFLILNLFFPGNPPEHRACQGYCGLHQFSWVQSD